MWRRHQPASLNKKLNRNFFVYACVCECVICTCMIVRKVFSFVFLPLFKNLNFYSWWLFRISTKFVVFWIYSKIDVLLGVLLSIVDFKCIFGSYFRLLFLTIFRNRCCLWCIFEVLFFLGDTLKHLFLNVSSTFFNPMFRTSFINFPQCSIKMRKW